MHRRASIGFGLILVLALGLTLGCTKKHIYTEPEGADRPGQMAQATQAPVQGAAETVEVLTMGEDLAEEPLAQEPLAREAAPTAEAPAEPGLVETTYSNEPAPDTRPVVETTTPVESPTAMDVEDPMSPEAMAEEPMPFEPPDQSLADPGHEAQAIQPQPEARPEVVTADGNFDQTGLASWVADENKGLPTASGELYDPADMTAAHRTYPLNTRLEVTNLETGRSVVVRINDRGPFKKERVVDLSRAAAQELGIIDQGTAQVGIRVVDEAPAAPAAAPAGGGVYIQVGAYSSQAAADEILNKLVTAGYSGSRVVKASNETVYRVQAGGFKTETEARSALEFLLEEFPGSFVVKE